MLSCILRGSLICSLGVTLGRNWEACQNNFHYGIRGVARGTVASRATSLVISAPFSSIVGCSAIFGGLPGGRRTLPGLCFSRSVTSGGAFILELLKEGARIARG